MPTHPPIRYAGLHIAAWWASAGLKGNRHPFTLSLFRHGRPFPMARPAPPDLKLESHLLQFPIVGRLRKSALPTSLDGLTKQAKQTRPCTTPPQPAERNFLHSVVCAHAATIRYAGLHIAAWCARQAASFHKGLGFGV